MADPNFQDIPPHVSALGDVGSALGRLVGGGLLLLAVGVGLLVYGSRRDDAAPETLAPSRAESGSGAGFGGGTVSGDAPGGAPTELLVRAAPAGATIHVDGDSVGTGPDWQGTVAEGERWVRVVTPSGRVVADTLIFVLAGTQAEFDTRPADGRAVARAVTSAPPTAATVPAAVPATGWVRVTSSPDGATVRIDGRPAGRTPLQFGNLQPGSHGVVVEREGYEASALQVDVAAGDGSTVAVSLRPTPAAGRPPRPGPPPAAPAQRPVPAPAAPAQRAGMGSVDVLVRPWGRIVIDGVPRTQDTDVLYHTMLPVGEHQIEAVHPTLGSKALTVTVTASGRVRVEFDLDGDAKD